MRVSLLAAAVAAPIVCCALLTSPVPAQGPAGHNIAVVDVSIIFKEHQRFLQMTDKFKKDVAAAEARLKQEYNEIQELKKQLEGLQPGSPDYKQMEIRVAKAGTDWQLRGQMQKKELMEAEGRIYFQVYRELDDSVKRFAQKHSIALVLRYASDPIDDPLDRAEIVKGINKSVVYVDPRLDITTHILADLNRGGAAAVNPRAPGDNRPLR